MKIKTILFDLGNVIIKFDPAIAEKGYSSYGKIKKDVVVDYIMNSREVDKYMEGKLTSSKFYTVTCRKFNLNIKFKDFYEVWNDIFYSYPEMEKLILELKKKYPELKLILVSNTNKAHYEFLQKKYDVLKTFDGHVLSHEIGCIKPGSRIFKEALRVAGSMPKETFYTDDRQDLIDAARVMGIRAFLFTGDKELKKQLSTCGILL
ncbi:MAG: HAD family phosphatase [Candidatus Aadella gelida]|nr:HAD family phosphatase [Candidatus Aadella gelida]